MSENTPNRKKNNTVGYVALAIVFLVLVGTTTWQKVENRRYAEESAIANRRAAALIERRNNPTAVPSPAPINQYSPVSDTWQTPVFFDENTLAVFNAGTGGGTLASNNPLSTNYLHSGFVSYACSTPSTPSNTSLRSEPATGILTQFKNPIYEGIPYENLPCEPAHIGVICIENTLYSILWSGGHKIDHRYKKPEIETHHVLRDEYDPISPNYDPSLRRAEYGSPAWLSQHDLSKTWSTWTLMNYLTNTPADVRYDLLFNFPHPEETYIEFESTWNVWHTFVGADNEFMLLTGDDLLVGMPASGARPDWATSDTSLRLIEFMQNYGDQYITIRGDFSGTFNMIGAREAIQPVIDWCYHRTPVDAAPIRPDWLYTYDGPFNHLEDRVSFNGRVSTLEIRP